MADYAEMPVFDKSKSDLGIHMACEQFDKLGLTLFERWWACHCIENAARSLLGDAFGQLVERLGDDLGVEAGDFEANPVGDADD